MRAEMADHLELRHVERVLGHAHDPLEARRREERDSDSRRWSDAPGTLAAVSGACD
jgi:hypothetical protein